MVPAFNERRPLAVAQFYEAYRPEVLLRVKQILRELPGAEDLVNDIFYKLLQRKVRFKTLKNIENYLGRLMLTMCRDYKKRRKTPVIKMEEVQEHYQRLEDRATRDAEISGTVQAIHYIALQFLSPQCRDVFIMSYIRDMRNKEIAERLNISLKTVENHIHIGLNKIRKEYKKDDGRMYFIRFLIPVLWDQLTSL